MSAEFTAQHPPRMNDHRDMTTDRVHYPGDSPNDQFKPLSLAWKIPGPSGLCDPRPVTRSSARSRGDLARLLPCDPDAARQPAARIEPAPADLQLATGKSARQRR